MYIQVMMSRVRIYSVVQYILTSKVETMFLAFFPWAVLSDEQMSNGWSYSLLNDEQFSNKVVVKHLPVSCYTKTH